MGEIYGQHIIDELVGIVGMLSSRKGSTLKDVASVLENLHGPVRKDVIQDGLREAVSWGMLECNHRRYKLPKQRETSGRHSPFDSAGCSSWGIGVPRETDLREDVFSDSSLPAQVVQYLGEQTSRPPSESSGVEEIPSGKSIQGSDQLSSCSYFRSEESLNGFKPKERKRKGKKHLIVKLPLHKKYSAAENDTENAAEKLNKHQQEINKDNQTKEPLLNDTEVNTFPGKNEDNHLPAKRSMNGIMDKVMKQFSKCKNPSDSNDFKKEVVSTANECEATHDDMSKLMLKVMTKVNNCDQSDIIKAPETVSRDSEESGSVKSLDGVITKVMKRITGGDVQPTTTQMGLENINTSLCAVDESNIKTLSVGTKPQGILPSCSNNKIPKSAKRGKKVKRESDSNIVDCHRYLTRSRVKANELRRTCVQSPSNSDTSSKRAKLSED